MVRIAGLPGRGSYRIELHSTLGHERGGRCPRGEVIHPGSKELLNKEGEIHLFEEIKACTFEVTRLHAYFSVVN